MIIPLGPGFELTIGGETQFIDMVGADINVGVLFFLAISSLAVYSVV